MIPTPTVLPISNPQTLPIILCGCGGTTLQQAPTVAELP
jgi:hypothetical protein